MKIDLPNKVILGIVSLSVIAAIVVTGYRFFWEKDYQFVVEAACDPSMDICFTRSCDNASDCPPNKLEQYKIFEISAADFEVCSDDSCSRECETGVLSCVERLCSVESGDECSQIESEVSEKNLPVGEDSQEPSGLTD